MAEITLKGARELVGVTQLQLERDAGLTRGTIHDLESGRTASPSHETVVKIVRALRRHGLTGIDGEALFPVPERTRVA